MSKQKRWEFYVTVVGMVAGVSLLALALEALIAHPPVRNHHTLGFVGALVVPPLVILLAFACPSRWLAASIGLMIGGALANALVRNFVGPVADYILVPFYPDMYCNLADIAIFVGLMSSLIFVVRLFFPGFFEEGTSEKAPTEDAPF